MSTVKSFRTQQSLSSSSSSSCPSLYRSEIMVGIIHNLGVQVRLIFESCGTTSPGKSVFADCRNILTSKQQPYSRFDVWFFTQRLRNPLDICCFWSENIRHQNLCTVLILPGKYQALAHRTYFNKENIHTTSQLKNHYAVSVIEAWYLQKQGPRSAGTQSSVWRAQRR